MPLEFEQFQEERTQAVEINFLRKLIEKRVFGDYPELRGINLCPTFAKRRVQLAVANSCSRGNLCLKINLSETVQELIIEAQNTRYRLAIWKTPTGKYLKGKLPEKVRALGHFGVMLRSYLLYQYHHCHVTQPKLLEQMREWQIDISAGQLNRLLVEDKEAYHGEKQDILRVGLMVSSYINTDDTSARHQGVNSYCTQIGNEWRSDAKKWHRFCASLCKYLSQIRSLLSWPTNSSRVILKTNLTLNCH